MFIGPKAGEEFWVDSTEDYRISEQEGHEGN